MLLHVWTERESEDGTLEGATIDFERYQFSEDIEGEAKREFFKKEMISVFSNLFGVDAKAIYEDELLDKSNFGMFLWADVLEVELGHEKS